MKKEKTRLQKTFSDYVNRLQDLSDNPKYEDMSNRKINPLYKENDQMMLDALLVNEDETAEILSHVIPFERLYIFLKPIQLHFKSQKIAKSANQALLDIKNNVGGWTSEDSYKLLKRKVNSANKGVENKE